MNQTSDQAVISNLDMDSAGNTEADHQIQQIGTDIDPGNNGDVTNADGRVQEMEQRILTAMLERLLQSAIDDRPIPLTSPPPY